MAAHRAGRLDEARAGYETVLAAAPHDADATGLLGVVALQQDRPEEAEALLRASIARPGPDPRILIRNLNNLFAFLVARKKWIATWELAGGGLPDIPAWPGDAPPNAAERASVLSLCEALSSFGASAPARALMLSAIPHMPGDPEALLLLGRLHVACDAPDDALSLLEPAAAHDPGNWQILAALSAAWAARSDGDAARALTGRCLQAAPVYIAPAESGHEATILVLNPAPQTITRTTGGLHGLHFAKNFIGQASVELSGELRFASVFADLAGDVPELPTADVVFNNIASGDEMTAPGRLTTMEALVGRIGRPVINHPRGIFRMSRQKANHLLAGIPGLKLPRIMRFRRDMVQFALIAADVEENFTYPVIVRHPAVDQSSHSLESEVKTAFLVHDRAELGRALDSVAWAQFYVIQFVDLRQPDGSYRKLRAHCIGAEVFIGSAGFAAECMVSGSPNSPTARAFYRAFPHLLETAHRIGDDPDGMLGPHVLSVLEALRARVPLDLFGIDFDVDADGQVVLFEAQSTMVFLQRQSTPREFRAPDDRKQRSLDAFRTLVRRKIAEAG